MGLDRRLTEAVGGAYLPLASKDAVALNPLDLAGSRGGEALAEVTSSLTQRPSESCRKAPSVSGPTNVGAFPKLQQSSQMLNPGIGPGDQP